jgi:hypothetical protein
MAQAGQDSTVPPDGPRTVSVTDAARRLGISTRTAWRRLHTGELEAVTVRVEGQPGKGRTAVTLASVERARDRAMETAAGKTDSVPPPSGVTRQPDTTVAQLAQAVAQLTAQLAAVDDERRRLTLEVEQLRHAALRALPAPGDTAAGLLLPQPAVAEKPPVGSEQGDARAPDLARVLKQAGVKGKKARRQLVGRLTRLWGR